MERASLARRRRTASDARSDRRSHGATRFAGVRRSHPKGRVARCPCGRAAPPARTGRSPSREADGNACRSRSARGPAKIRVRDQHKRPITRRPQSPRTTHRDQGDQPHPTRYRAPPRSPRQDRPPPRQARTNHWPDHSRSLRLPTVPQRPHHRRKRHGPAAVRYRPTSRSGSDGTRTRDLRRDRPAKRF
jgi:hypothetical protein